MDLLIWAGPVYGPGKSPYQAGDIGRVQWANPTQILTVSGNGSSYFASLAESLRDGDGRILAPLLARYGQGAPSDYDHIAVAGFSAAHGLLNQILLTDGDMIDAAVLLDSCFSAAEGYAGKRGYVDFGQRAAKGERLMVLTSSQGQNNAPLPPSTTGSECAYQSFLDASGGDYDWFDIPSPLPPIAAYSSDAVSTGARSLRRNGLYLLDYGSMFLHGDHVNKLSVDVLQTFLAPYLGGDTSLVGGSVNLKHALYVAGVVGLAALAFYWTTTGKKNK